MAKTEISTSHALRVEKWSALLWQYPRYKSFFSKFIGKNTKARGVALKTDPNALCQMIMDFRKGKGDKVTFPMTAPLRGEGRVEGEKLEDHEEAMSFYNWAVELKKVRHAVRTDDTDFIEKRLAFDFKVEAKNALGIWSGHKIDGYSLAALTGVASSDGNVAANAPSTNRKLYGGQTVADVLTTETTDAAIANGGANDEDNYLFGPMIIDAAKRKALITEPKVRPIIINGKEHYVHFIHPYQHKALRASALWQNAQRNANIRGEKNPLFSGALGIWNNVIIHEYEKIETRLGDGVGTSPATYFESGDPVPNGKYVARSLFCGAQSVVQAWGKLPTFIPKNDFDYFDEWGIASKLLVGVSKPEFNSEDYGVIIVDTAYEPD